MKKNIVVSSKSIEINTCPNKIPKQKNGYDCGLFVIMYAQMLYATLKPGIPISPDQFSKTFFSKKDVLAERTKIKEFYEK